MPRLKEVSAEVLPHHAHGNEKACQPLELVRHGRRAVPPARDMSLEDRACLADPLGPPPWALNKGVQK